MVVENESQSQEIGEKLTEEKETLNNKVVVDMMHKVADETEKEEERKEELVDFEDSQDKLGIKRKRMFLSHRNCLLRK
jgi:hypothetical protein